ncbi:hypothetical protein QE152_g22288 [Popillia japonica]|uniref:Uncharacterized protein n=1 Tax=Popillia japonica TaxID=7064 RepID=A0AAW1KKW4_POPJA
MCRENLKINIQPSDIDISHRLKGKENCIRPIIVRFTSRLLKKHVFNAKRRLKGTKTVIKEDLTPLRVILLKQLSRQAPSNSFWTSDGNIFAKVGNTIHRIKTSDDIQ